MQKFKRGIRGRAYTVEYRIRPTDDIRTMRVESRSSEEEAIYECARRLGVASLDEAYAIALD